MDDAEIRARLDPGSGYGELPAQHVTINQVVAWNLIYWRKTEGLTQEELGERLGWSAAVVSAAERSWDAKRIRQFTVDDLVNIADALDIPAAALLLPPSDDGQELRYVFHMRNGDVCHSMRHLLDYATSDPPPDDTVIHNAYRDRFVAALNFYWGAGPEQDLKYIADLTEEERLVDRLARLRDQYVSLRDILGDNDKMQEALSARLGELRREKDPSKQAWVRLTPSQREWQAQVVAIGKELFGERGPVDRAMINQVIEEARRRGITPASASDIRNIAVVGDEDGAYRLVAPPEEAPEANGDPS